VLDQLPGSRAQHHRFANLNTKAASPAFVTLAMLSCPFAWLIPIKPCATILNFLHAQNI
jgi:hypothetical protein